jgi:replicative DNA helicase
MSAIPYSEATEAAVIGVVIVYPDRVLEEVIATGLRPGHFHVPAMSRAWEAVLDLHAEGTPVDAHTVAGKVDDRQAVARAIATAADAMPTNAPAWAGVVIRDARARQMLTPLAAALEAARAGQVDEVFELLHATLDAAEVANHVCH